MKFNYIFFTCVLLFVNISTKVHASFQQDTLKKVVVTDSSSVVKTDSIKKKSKPGEITDVIKAVASDSSFYDVKENVMYLFGNARITYGEAQVDAGYIKVDYKDNTVFAKGITDSLGRFSGLPIFKDPSQGALTADSVFYNFKTEKGKIFQVYSEQDGGYITGGKIKKQVNDEVHMKNVIYSTCDLPSPHQHFGIVITKGIATQNQIVTGPAYMFIEDVPLPFVIPFGFFPKPNKRASGILLPQVGEDATLGFFLRDFGYYIGLNDYWDLTLKGGVYSKGSYEANAASRYTKRYKYSGNLYLSYSSRKFGVEGTPEFENPTKDFQIRWSHQQNPNARPGTNFGASVNASTRGAFKNVPGYSYQQIVQNQLSSSISYSKNWANSPFSLTTALTHSQDLSTGTVSISLPSLNFSMSTLNPFDSKERVGEQKWYQRIAVGYSMQADNQLNTFDSLLFKNESLRRLRSGVQHNIPISMSSKVLKFFQFSQSINYSEKWYFQTIRKQYVARPTPMGTIDSVALDTIPGFRRASDYSVGGSLSTKIYGMVNFKKGKLMAVRHVITPNVGFSYRPDFGQAKFGYYDSLQVDQYGRKQAYSIFENSLYGGPGNGKSAAINFGLDNNIEIKVRSAKDTTNNGIRKIPILQGLSVNGSYNFVADSLKLSQLSFGGRTFFTEKLGVSFSGSFDPYVFYTETVSGRLQGRNINRYRWQDGKLPRLTNFNFSFDYSLNSTSLGKNNRANNPPPPGNNADLFNRVNAEQAEQLQQISRNANAFVDFNIPWNLSFYYNFNYSNSGLQKQLVQTLNANGDFNLTPKWKVQFNTGYDFRNNAISLTSFSIYRDLHCWDMSIRWIPFGPYQSYSIDLRVKSSILQDLKLSKRREYYNQF
ncbi:putative LPS assembly protein LptD [Pedobacter arcticus]|uniref:putative LPS assembly protein LptD n=1 Tax=Pedobacter arcticus TaxID=752140 RepID=UPI0002F2A6F5|nr:putative LPS assembly protein LptD [Pedobacter arcticus]